MFSKIKINKLIIFLLLPSLIIIDCAKKDTIDEPVELTNDANINLDDIQQVIRGFGGMNMPGWIPDLTLDQVNKAFGMGVGQIGMTILRIRVPYDKTFFSLEVPTARLAKSLGAIIFATPWTPPPSLKSNNNIVGGILNDSSYDSYSEYLKSFSDYMSSNGASLYAVSLQNEPDVPSVTYESCSWNAAMMLKFVKNNVSSIGINIIVPESFNFNHTISDAILNDDIAVSKISIIGGHIYGGGLSNYPLALSKGKEVWMTEHLVVDTDWRGAFNTAREINDCMSAGMNAYIWWYIRRFYGPIDDDGMVTKRGYAISQYTRFVRPGFNRVGTTINPKTYVDVTAYKNGSKIIIVAINGNYSAIDQTFIIHNGTVNTFTPYVTSSTRSCSQENDIKVLNNSFAFNLEEQSVTTFVSN